MRTLGSFRHEKKTFNFRVSQELLYIFNETNRLKITKCFVFHKKGSLGRALSKKIKREISSPLIDDDTLKRIESKHKIVDMKDLVLNNSII
jgi:hypothetical protein